MIVVLELEIPTGMIEIILILIITEHGICKSIGTGKNRIKNENGCTDNVDYSSLVSIEFANERVEKKRYFRNNIRKISDKIEENNFSNGKRGNNIKDNITNDKKNEKYDNKDDSNNDNDNDHKYNDDFVSKDSNFSNKEAGTGDLTNSEENREEPLTTIEQTLGSEHNQHYDTNVHEAIEINVDGRRIPFLVDTGADISLISNTFLLKNKYDLIGPPIEILGIGAQKIYTLGQTQLEIDLGNSGRIVHNF